MILFITIIFVLAGAICLWLFTKNHTNKCTLSTTTEILKGLPYFDQLTTNQLQLLIPHIDILEVEKECCLIKEHGGDDSLYFVISGSVNIVKKGAVYQTLIKELNTGEFFGEMAFLTGSTRIASAMAPHKSKFLKIRKSAYTTLQQVAPEIEEVIWQACDSHTINLFLADHEELRSSDAKAKETWIDRRQVVEGPTKLTQVESFSWLAVVAGSIKIGDLTIEAPSLIHLPTTEIIIPQKARICLLPTMTIYQKKELS